MNEKDEALIKAFQKSASNQGKTLTMKKLTQMMYKWKRLVATGTAEDEAFRQTTLFMRQ